VLNADSYSHFQAILIGIPVSPDEEGQYPEWVKAKLRSQLSAGSNTGASKAKISVQSKSSFDLDFDVLIKDFYEGANGQKNFRMTSGSLLMSQLTSANNNNIKGLMKRIGNVFSPPHNSGFKSDGSSEFQEELERIKNDGEGQYQQGLIQEISDISAKMLLEKMPGKNSVRTFDLDLKDSAIKGPVEWYFAMQTTRASTISLKVKSKSLHCTVDNDRQGMCKVIVAGKARGSTYGIDVKYKGDDTKWYWPDCKMIFQTLIP